MIITSKSNNIVKYVSSLDNKKYRNKYNKYVIEGIKMVEEIINSEGNTPEFIIYSSEILKKTSLGKSFLDSIIPVIDKYNFVHVSEDVFVYMSEIETPQGVMAVLEKNQYNIEDLELNLNSNKNQKYLILDRVQDPGNLGTIIRTAVSFGITNLICLEGTADAFSSKVVRSTMSGITKIKIYYISNDDVDKLFKILKQNSYISVGTSLKATSYIHNADIDDKCVFVMGNEANGVSEEVLKCCDKLVKIPMDSKMESLNVSIATGILIYEQYIRGENNAS